MTADFSRVRLNPLAAYAGVRQWIVGRLLARERMTTERMFEHLYRMARQAQTRPARMDEQLAGLKAALEKHFGRTIEATVSVNPELIGGARIVVGDKVIDGSVRSKLAAMARDLRA